MTKVIFRKFVKSGDVVAMFPELPWSNDPAYCVSYQTIGQHGAAFAGPIEGTTLATVEEYAPLMAELKSIGYTDLVVVARFSRNDYDKRRETIKAQ